MMNYFKFFTEVWRFFKKYYNRPGKEQDYTESVQECSQLAKSFGNGDFVDRVCICSPRRTGTLLEGQRGGVDGSDWNHRVLRGDHLCGGVAAEPGRASEGSGRGPGAGRISYGMEQESWEE